ncbi:hypothetical protein AGR7B_pAt0227 [Agrobacterium deltaense RV3]|nr:hypothetical protein AGR7B_pAt0227 [Agrobacterium deltaense RV3]
MSEEAVPSPLEFFENDEIPSLRGLGTIRRMARQTSELLHADVMEETIITASRTGAAIKSPEPGLWYVAITDEAVDVNATLQEFGLARPIVYRLTSLKQRGLAHHIAR